MAFIFLISYTKGTMFYIYNKVEINNDSQFNILFWLFKYCNGGWIWYLCYFHHVTEYSLIQFAGIVTGGEYGSGRGCQPVSFPPCNRVFSNKGPLCTDQTKPSLRCHTRCTNEDYSVPYNKDRHRGNLLFYFRLYNKVGT